MPRSHRACTGDQILERIIFSCMDLAGITLLPWQRQESNKQSSTASFATKFKELLFWVALIYLGLSAAKGQRWICEIGRRHGRKAAHSV
ncbi:hypothetical protein JOM56_010642 [Amanita muscaria]